MSELATTTPIASAGVAALEAYIAAGDIARLTQPQRIALYRSVCHSLGLNELTQPFQYLNLSGKTVLYATKSCTEQLRQIHGVSVVSMESREVGDAYIVTCRVRDRTGREDIATGAVHLGNAKGDNLANALMKAETKAKRRATLSICGLAILDETEIETISGAQIVTVSESHVDVEKPKAVSPAAMRSMSPAERSADTKRLLASTREEFDGRAPEPPPAAIDDLFVIPPTARIAAVKTRNGEVWRVDIEGREKPIAVRDPSIASGIEANLAFSEPTYCRLTHDGKRDVVTEIVKVAKEVSA